ncbi:protein phosphatase regulator, partial [Dipsacomyces acuminosporus]
MTEPASHDDLIQQWLAVNPGTEEQARFYLEANNWNLNAALSNFYEEPPLSEGLPPLRQDDPALPLDPNPAGAGPEFHPPAAAPVVSGGPSYPSSVPQTAAPSSASVPRRRYGSGARIATLSSLEHAEDDENEDEDGQDWYAGGERSGMAVRAPPKSDGSNDDDGTRGSLVDRILRRAAEESARADAGGPSSRAERTKPERFTGRGRALGSAEAPLSSSSSLSQPRAGGSNRGSADNNNDHDNDNDNDEVAVRELTFWRNGFSIGDGPLYNTEDPRNRQILEALLQGRAPLDILNVRPGQQVEMK